MPATKYNSINIYIALLINLILFSIFYSLITPIFQTNDDPGLLSIITDHIYAFDKTGKDLWWSHYYIGNILSLLYDLNNHINWYGIYLIFICYISFTILHYIMLQKWGTKYGIIVYLIFFIPIASEFLIGLQFTTEAGLLLFSGLLLLHYGIEQKNKTIILVSMLVTILGSMIRWEMFLFCIIIFGVWLFILALISRSKLKKNIVLYSSYLIVISTALILNTIDRKHYDADTLANAKIITSLTDYSSWKYLSQEEQNTALKETGLSQNDIKMCSSFAYVDWNDINNAQFQKLSKYLPKINIKPAGEIINDFITIFKSYLPSLALLIGACSFLLLVLHKNKTELIVLGITFLSVLIILFLTPTLSKSLPPRVLYPIFLFLIIISLFSISQISQNYLKYVIGILVIITLYNGHKLYRRSQLHQKIQNQIITGIKQNLNPSKYYLVWNAEFGLEYSGVFHTLDIYRKYKFIPTGRLTELPVFTNYLKSHKIIQLYKEIPEKDIHLLINTSVAEISISKYKTYYKEHYKKEIDAVLVKKLPPFLTEEISEYRFILK